MIAERLFRSTGHWLFTVFASLLILGIQVGGDELRRLLQFDRAALLAGEWYRLVSGHWVHLDWRHAGMNVAGLWLLALVDMEDRPTRERLLDALLCCVVLSVAVGLLLLARHPHLGWYLGLSGVLHGLFAVMLLRALWLHQDRMALLVLLLLIGKLAWEHYHGALTQGTLAAPVIVEAHSYGALAGMGYALIAIVFTRHSLRRKSSGE